MYKHLSREERYQIHNLLNAKQTITEIARSLRRSRSTISREFSSSRGQHGHRAPNKLAPKRLSGPGAAVIPAV
jgi:IS30 family transposase